MGLFDKLKAPVLYKDSTGMKKQIEILEALKEKASGETKNLIRKDIRLLEYGLQGEESVLFELTNSFTPMIILRDLHFEFGDLSAQIDFIVIMRKVVFIIECKNLFGDIAVNESGDFIRTITYGGRKVREGIYSPITQNKRHLEIIKAIRKDSGNIITKMSIEKFFDENCKSVIVMANNKTVMDTRKADKGIRNQILRNDQLISHLKMINEKSKNAINSDKTMYEIADRFLSMHIPSRKDYTAKYNILQEDKDINDEDINASNEIETEVVTEVVTEAKSVNAPEIIDRDDLYDSLKAYRLNKSREEEVKAYYIFTNAQLEELTEAKPLSLESLRKISGFGEVKVSKYGEDIVNIIREHIR